MDTIALPPYRDANIDRRKPYEHEGYLVYHATLGSFPQATDVAWNIVKHILAGIDALADPENMFKSDIGQLVRAEFFWNEGLPQHRGVVLYDNKGHAVMHVIHALLGYGGAGPMLSQLILEALGVPIGMFNKANESAASRNYVLVFSREQVSNGTVVPYGTPREVWDSWRVR
ncbi:hypothetical protein KDA08_03210 [Candidatus Saccharibacteria bacterium]|nr:hypothetical protein [Candidatus Saccharibacteria bacterium]